MTGSSFLNATEHLSSGARETRIVAEITSGNVPDFLRSPVPVPIRRPAPNAPEIVVRVLPDYLAVGSDDDFVLMPMTAVSAQRIADAFGCLLPTERLVDAIWQSAQHRLWLVGQRGKELCATDALMITNACYWQYEKVLRKQRLTHGVGLGGLTAGHKKDIIISAAIHRSLPSGHLPVILYGGRNTEHPWDPPTRGPVQPSRPIHYIGWVDYAQGVRLVEREVWVDGTPMQLQSVLASSSLHSPLSPEPLTRPFYLYPGRLEP